MTLSKLMCKYPIHYNTCSPYTLIKKSFWLASKHVRSFHTTRCLSQSCEEKKGMILGCYEGETEMTFTSAATKFNDHLGGLLCKLVKKAGPLIRRGECKLFNNIDPEFWSIVVVGLGKEGACYNQLEAIDEGLENVRVAAGLGAQVLINQGVSRILVEGLGQAEQAAEGSALALWRYQENKSDKILVPTLELFDDPDCDGFQRGLFKAECQNLARRLTETPANQMTALHFAQEVINELCPCGIRVAVHDKEWMESRKMNLFLASVRGSCEPPVCIEISYCGAPADQKPIFIAAKGTTFDSGGLCLKNKKNLDLYRASMSGGAAVVASMRAAASLSLPINIDAVILLGENMPSGMSMKCADLEMSINNKSVMISNVDNEGQLALADALCYGQTVYKPRLVIDVASLTSGVRDGLGSSASGVFTNSQTMWSQIRKAGVITGDRVWRLPLWKHFSENVNSMRSHDVDNEGLGHGSPCLAAAFLNEFIDCVDWIHIDTKGTSVLSEHKVYPYLTKGRMTGRPTRTLIQLFYQLACPCEGKRKLQ